MARKIDTFFLEGRVGQFFFDVWSTSKQKNCTYIYNFAIKSVKNSELRTFKYLQILTKETNVYILITATLGIYDKFIKAVVFLSFSIQIIACTPPP